AHSDPRARRRAGREHGRAFSHDHRAHRRRGRRAQPLGAPQARLRDRPPHRRLLRHHGVHGGRAHPRRAQAYPARLGRRAAPHDSEAAAELLAQAAAGRGAGRSPGL
ncbi:MAG: SSU ribosomal protein S6p, partial [uncultured Rubrobacteraceae bacterium]